MPWAMAAMYSRQMHARQFLVFCRGRYMQTGFWQILGNRSRNRRYLAMGKRVPSGNGSTNSSA